MFLNGFLSPGVLEEAFFGFSQATGYKPSVILFQRLAIKCLLMAVLSSDTLSNTINIIY